MNKLLIGGVLAVGALLVLFAPEPEDDSAQPVVRASRGSDGQQGRADRGGNNADNNAGSDRNAGNRAGSSGSSAGSSAVGIGANSGLGTSTNAASAANPANPFSLQIKPREEQDFGNLFATAPTPAPVVAMVRKTSAPKIVAPPAGPPQAPPLPFQYMGRWLQDGEVSYFLQLNGRNLVLRVGDTVDQTYKLEQASAGTLSFVYLPLNQKQSMAVGEVN